MLINITNNNAFPLFIAQVQLAPNQTATVNAYLMPRHDLATVQAHQATGKITSAPVDNANQKIHDILIGKKVR